MASFDAYDIATGHRAWRFYDSSLAIRRMGLLKTTPSGPLGKTWGGEYWKGGGGGAVWDGMAYDPDLNLVYVGTGNAGTAGSKVSRRNGSGQSIYVLHPGSSMC